MTNDDFIIKEVNGRITCDDDTWIQRHCSGRLADTAQNGLLKNLNVYTDEKRQFFYPYIKITQIIFKNLKINVDLR